LRRHYERRSRHHRVRGRYLRASACCCHATVRRECWSCTNVLDIAWIMPQQKNPHPLVRGWRRRWFSEVNQSGSGSYTRPASSRTNRISRSATPIAPKLTICRRPWHRTSVPVADPLHRILGLGRAGGAPHLP